MKTIRVPFRALVLIFAMATFAFAQSSGSITGTVKDSKGAIISGANVTAADPGQGVNLKAQTNDMGVFIFPQILAGTYTISVEMSGFKKVDKTMLPHKIWTDCLKCVKFPDCDEIAVVRELG